MSMRLALLATLASLPVAVRAVDIERGTAEITGDTSVGFSSSTQTSAGNVDISTTAWSAGAGVLFHVAPPFSLGVGGSFRRSSTDVAGSSSHGSGVAFGPEVQFDIPAGEQVGVFARGGLQWAHQESSATGASSLSANGWAANVGAGVKYFPVQAVSLDFALTYSMFRIDVDNGPRYEQSGFGAGAGISIYVR
ncbi:outer membrane beta-barrel protein [Anaeromyxobacter oryzae]|uniref:Outer membrane protein beta-barrel domain-containing protein n=1 Tax=Anaeromyxobacter oryzae TaxID=2918170 RepID=A0ABM7WUQ7_9BACT|nr:outer membrane beta-barrel protein [Anaeromyxobacter oryzae]BDG03232.1 hypothetical protein AMOR_22280 [Anaeromyxobacter oryzae]